MLKNKRGDGGSTWLMEHMFDLLLGILVFIMLLVAFLNLTSCQSVETMQAKDQIHDFKVFLNTLASKTPGTPDATKEFKLQSLKNWFLISYDDKSICLCSNEKCSNEAEKFCETEIPIPKLLVKEATATETIKLEITGILTTLTIRNNQNNFELVSFDFPKDSLLGDKIGRCNDFFKVVYGNDILLQIVYDNNNLIGCVNTQPLTKAQLITESMVPEEQLRIITQTGYLENFTKAVICQESEGIPYAMNPDCEAIGLMQLTRGTAAYFKKFTNYFKEPAIKDEHCDPVQGRELSDKASAILKTQNLQIKEGLQKAMTELIKIDSRFDIVKNLQAGTQRLCDVWPSVQISDPDEALIQAYINYNKGQDYLARRLTSDEERALITAVKDNLAAKNNNCASSQLFDADAEAACDRVLNVMYLYYCYQNPKCVTAHGG